MPPIERVLDPGGAKPCQAPGGLDERPEWRAVGGDPLSQPPFCAVMGLARVRTLRRAHWAIRIAVHFKNLVKSQAAQDLPS